ncbi:MULTISPECIES: HAD-IIB family hydrolase [unclassified Sinorhizobium]|uniref:HAD-IIB family hydrolase n=1 Tax=unclassified Sinorhizobium TaxID=2613772 RepID=UPI0035245A1F
MYIIALATDYDGTLAEDGAVDAATIQALHRFRDSGRRLILVTGRELPDLKRVFDRLDLFDRVVAENGALLYAPATEEERPVAPAPPPQFVEKLRRKGVEQISVGRSIVATWEPHQTTVLDTIREMGLELEIIFNKGAVMVLPSGVNKASGLTAALEELELSPLNVAGVGDAENDHALLRFCGFGAAVANALPALKQGADLVLTGARGAGVVELITTICDDETAIPLNDRHRIPIGENDDGPIALYPNDVLLIAGSSGIGKSTLAIALTERMSERQAQFCIFDPEGDYEGLEGTVTLGDGKTPPTKEQVLQLLSDPSRSVVVNTLAFELQERPGFFATLMPDIAALRARTGRPHYLIIDEAHHLMPSGRDSASLALSDDVSGTIMITVHPDSLSPAALKTVTKVVALGPSAADVIRTVCAIVGETPHDISAAPKDDNVLLWDRRAKASGKLIQVAKPRQSHKRHTRKYAEGHLDEEQSFYFRGPNREMKLRAHNLMMFLQIAEGIDDGTWQHHLRAHDYSKWFKGHIGDPALAEETAAVEQKDSLSASESRRLIFEAVRRRYTAPASEKD